MRRFAGWLARCVTAIASVTTAVALPPLIPKVLTLVDEARVSGERRLALERARAELERRVEERTRILRPRSGARRKPTARAKRS